MQDKIQHIKVNEIEYPLVFNLNVMEKIQEQYGSTAKWGELTDGKRTDESGNNVEIDIKALKFGIKEMINEGIDIENEINSVNREFISDKTIGRIITDFGMEKLAQKMQTTVIESTKIEENSKNV